MTIAPYPLDVHSIQKNSPQHLKDTRTLLADQGSLLFKIILKSLVLRISREGKRPPVVMDDQYFFVLESLVTAIATEIVTNHPQGVQRYRRLNGALATFLRDLFAVIAPSQVSTLVDVYFTTMHGHHGKSKSVETDLRLQFLEEFSLFDYALAANFPYTLDSPLSLFSQQISSKLYPLNSNSSAGAMPPSCYSPPPPSKTGLLNSPTPGESYLLGRGGDREQGRMNRLEKEESVVLAYSARGLRGTSLDPTPHWLGHLIVAGASLLRLCVVGCFALQRNHLTFLSSFSHLHLFSSLADLLSSPYILHPPHRDDGSVPVRREARQNPCSDGAEGPPRTALVRTLHTCLLLYTLHVYYRTAFDAVVCDLIIAFYQCQLCTLFF
jgi:hypothetical protein